MLLYGIKIFGLGGDMSAVERNKQPNICPPPNISKTYILSLTA